MSYLHRLRCSYKNFSVKLLLFVTIYFTAMDAEWISFQVSFHPTLNKMIITDAGRRMLKFIMKRVKLRNYAIREALASFPNLLTCKKGQCYRQCTVCGLHALCLHFCHVKIFSSQSFPGMIAWMCLSATSNLKVSSNVTFKIHILNANYVRSHIATWAEL